MQTLDEQVVCDADGAVTQCDDVGFVGGGCGVVGVLDEGLNYGRGCGYSHTDDVGQTHDLADAVDVGVGFAVDEVSMRHG